MTGALVTNGHLNGVGGQNETQNNWTEPGIAAFDFRSDVMTRPTKSMLNAIIQTSLNDDVFQEDTVTNSLESYIAGLTGYEDALLVLSGTMGNQLSLRTHLQGPPHSILTDSRSHIMEYEAGGAASLSGALVKSVMPANGHHLTLRDVVKNAIVSDDVHACPTKVVALENTLAGTVLPLQECQAIARWARAQNPPIIMHLDGARLWEAVAAGAGSLKDYCACFDSVSLCFSKGLGAPIGSIIAGKKAFIKRARWVRKSIGGGLRQSGVVAAPARVAVEETFLGGKLQASHVMARKLEAIWVAKGGQLTHPVETNMVWLDLKGYRLTGEDDDQGWSYEGIKGSENKEDWVDPVMLAEKHGLKVHPGGRLVVHYQIGDEALARVDKFMDEVIARRAT